MSSTPGDIPQLGDRTPAGRRVVSCKVSAALIVSAFTTNRQKNTNEVPDTPIDELRAIMSAEASLFETLFWNLHTLVVADLYLRTLYNIASPVLMGKAPWPNIAGLTSSIGKTLLETMSPVSNPKFFVKYNDPLPAFVQNLAEPVRKLVDEATLLIKRAMGVLDERVVEKLNCPSEDFRRCSAALHGVREIKEPIPTLAKMESDRSLGVRYISPCNVRCILANEEFFKVLGFDGSSSYGVTPPVVNQSPTSNRMKPGCSQCLPHMLINVDLVKPDMSKTLHDMVAARQCQPPVPGGTSTDNTRSRSRSPR